MYRFGINTQQVAVKSCRFDYVQHIERVRLEERQENAVHIAPIAVDHQGRAGDISITSRRSSLSVIQNNRGEVSIA